MLIHTLDIGQKKKVASLDVTQNDVYCIYNVDDIYNAEKLCKYFHLSLL
jgi:hypothetical protein